MTHNRSRKPKKIPARRWKKCTGCNLTLEVSCILPENYRLSDIEVPLTATQEVTLSRREADWSAEAGQGKKSLIVWIRLDCQPRPILTVLFISIKVKFSVYKQSFVAPGHGVSDTRVPALRAGQFSPQPCGQLRKRRCNWGRLGKS